LIKDLKYYKVNAKLKLSLSCWQMV